MSGKRDRPAYFDIDEKTLEYRQNPDKDKEAHIDSQQKIGQRRIYKIKTPGEGNQESSASKPKFTLFQSSTKDKETDKPAQKKNEEDQQVPQSAEQSLKKQENKETEKKQQQKKPGSLFDFGENGQGLFGNGIGIFTNTPKTGLFTTNNIFAATNTPSIFKKDETKPSTSIFGNSQSIFNFSSQGVPPVKKDLFEGNGPKPAENDGGDDEGDSAQLEKDQNQTVDPSKSTGNYQYASNCEILFQAKALKVKKNNGELVENVEVIVEQDPEKKMNWIVVRLAATKNPIVTGILIKGKSEVKRIGNKDQNITLSVLVMQDKKPQKHVLKLQFENASDGKKFLQLVQSLIK